jgi:hypothetical protein
MARINFNDGQEIIYQDLNEMGAVVEKELYERVIFELVQRAENSMFDDGFLVSYSSPTQVSVSPGVGFQTDNTQTGSESKKRLLYRAASLNLNLTTPDVSNDRIDIVCIKAARVDGTSESRKYKAPISGTISSVSMVVDKDWEAELLIVAGTPSGSPAVPATPAGYIKIAELDVTTVTGLSGAGAVTDTRVIMPVGGLATINSLAFLRITASAALSLQQALEDVDALLVNGKATTNILADSVTDPAAPPSGTGVPVILYNKGGVLHTRDEAGVVTPVGSGGGGGGGAEWYGDALESFDATNEKIKSFVQGDSQKETFWIKVPQGYLTGRQIYMYLNHYSASAANQFKMQVVSTLIRKNLDAKTSTTNQRTVNSGDITNTVANMDRQLSFDITSATGTINSVGVTAGDRIKVELTRIAPTGTEDTADINMVPGSTEVKFA